MVMQWNGAPAPTPASAWGQPQAWMQQQWAAPAAVAPTLWQQQTAQSAPPQTWVDPNAPAPAWAGNLAGQGGYNQTATTANYTPPTMYAMQAAPPSSGTGGPAPTTPAGLSPAYAQTAPNQQQATTAAQGGTLDPGWNHDMLGEKAGQTWDGKQWVGGGAFRAAGSQLGVGGVTMTAAYDPNRDTSRYDISTHQGAETNWRRVNRWMEAGVREHGLTPQQAYDAALARLKRDYELNGQDWGTSGFDLSKVQSAAPGQDFGPQAATAAKTVGATGGTTGGTGGGTGATTPGQFGQLQTNDLAGLLQAAANDPDRAAQILRLAQGQQGRPLGRMADFRDSLYGRAFQTALATAGLDGFKDLQGTAQDFLNRGVLGNDLIGYGGDLSRRLAGQSFDGVDSATMEKELRAALALQGLNMGSLGGSVQQGRLDDLLYADWARNLADRGNDTRNFADLLRNSAFQRSLANYGR